MNTVKAVPNLLTSPFASLKKLFDTLEYPGFFDWSNNEITTRHSIFAARENFRRLQKECTLENHPKDISVATIYGVGGGNRYFVYKDGEIRFSAGHCHEDRVKKQAQELGLKLI